MTTEPTPDDDYDPLESPTQSSDTDGDSGDSGDGSRLPVSLKTVAIAVTAVFAVLLTAAVVVVAPFWWAVAYFALIIGAIPGLTLFPWITSPFGPGLWMLSEPFARIHLTISQFIRRVGVLVKRASNNYEIGVYLEDEQEAVMSDGRVPIDEERTSWGLFGKRKFGVTASKDTDFYQRVRCDTTGVGVVADGGEDVFAVNMAAVHRYFEGANDSDAISRTEEKAEAEYGGGSEELSGTAMGLLIGLMLLMGSMTTYVML
jgi:hypothetical protein